MISILRVSIVMLVFTFLLHLPVNFTAYFSKTDGCKLLTTDQYNQLRVYQAPEWTLSRTIQHPH